MKEYKPFTQIQDKLIPLSEESYNELKKSFLDNGFLRRKGLIEVWKGHDIIVDGHHRYAICKELGIEPEIEEVPFDSADEAELYALKNQRNRRNLTESQLIMVDVAIHDKEEQIAARMRQVALAGTRPNQQQADLRPESGPRSKGLSAEIVAKKIGKKKKQCQCCQMSAKCSIKILSRSIAKVHIWILQNTLLSFRDTAGRT